MSAAEYINIRPTQKQDTEPVFRLASGLKPLTEHTWYTYWNLCNNFSDSCFVTEAGGKLVAFMTSHPTTTPPDEWFIWQAGILPDYRGLGLIDKLQDKVIEVAQAAGAVAIRTTVEEDNLASHKVFNRLATRLGAEVEELESFTVPGADVPEVLYRLPLPLLT